MDLKLDSYFVGEAPHRESRVSLSLCVALNDGQWWGFSDQNKEQQEIDATGLLLWAVRNGSIQSLAVTLIHRLIHNVSLYCLLPFRLLLSAASVGGQK